MPISLYIEYLEINPTFPLYHSNDLNETQKQMLFFKILQHCYKYGEAPLNIQSQHIKLNDIDFEPSIECITQTEYLYRKQCPKLFCVSFADQLFLKYLAVGRSMNHFPFLQYMTDCYVRERLHHSIFHDDDAKKEDVEMDCEEDVSLPFNRPNSIRSQNELTLAKWSEHNQYLQQFEATHPKQWIEIQSAMSSYIKRICPQWLFAKRIKIRDDVSSCCDHILASDRFVSNLTNNTDYNCYPFQFDFAIAVKEIETENNDGYPFKTKRQNKKRKYRDVIGDIHDKLSSNECVFDSDVVMEERPSRPYYKAYNDVYQRFCSKMTDKYGDEMKYYPRKRRFCAIVDRRRIYSEHDVLSMYDPPSNCNALPERNHVAECYFNTSKTCFLPRKDYQNGIDQECVEMTKINEAHMDKLLRTTISNTTPNNEGFLFLSYHVESKDQIKCYLWWKLQCIRFFPSDLRNLLPEMFVDSYAKNTQFRNDYALINHKMKNFKCNDQCFEYWYQTITARSAS